jgi:hypothetical protein
MLALTDVLRNHSPYRKTCPVTAGAMISMRLQETSGQVEYQDSRSRVADHSRSQSQEETNMAFKER